MKQLEGCSTGLSIDWALIISIIVAIFTLMKDFIIPLLLKPKLKFIYKEEVPYRRENVIINNVELNKGSFIRFSVINVGKRPALNCRCQIFKLEQSSKRYGDYIGFPLRWASRPESLIDSSNGERLNIAIGETEFIDLAFTTSNNNYINLQKYHNVDIGIKEVIEPGEYLITLIFSGDNFKPYKIKFQITKEDSNAPNKIKVSLKETER
jgi:hypothetical protein